MIYYQKLHNLEWHKRKNKIMKGIIFCNKLETGVTQLKEIVGSYHSIGINLSEKVAMGNRYEKALMAKFDNGDEWTVVRAGNNIIWQSCNIAYIDRMIDNKIIDNQIMSTIKEKPYQAFRYYNWGNW